MEKDVPALLVDVRINEEVQEDQYSEVGVRKKKRI